jgi:hypothetical protein
MIGYMNQLGVRQGATATAAVVIGSIHFHIEGQTTDGKSLKDGDLNNDIES